MKKGTIVIGFLFFCFASHSQYYMPKYHSVQPDFPQSEYTGLFRSKDPFLYLTCKKGLIRYDGKNFQTIARPEPEKSATTAVFFDGYDVWLGYEDGAIFKNNVDQLLPWRPGQISPKTKITHLEKEKNGQIWVTTYGEGIFVFDGKTTYNILDKDGLGGNDIYDGVIIAENTMLVSTDEGLYTCNYQPGKTEVTALEKHKGIHPIFTKIWFDKIQNKVIARSSDHQVYTIDLATGQKEVIQFPFAAGEGLSYFNGSIFVIMESGDRPLWVYNTHQKKMESFALRGLERDFSMIDMLADESGILWLLCKNNGLISIKTALVVYDLPLRNIQAMACDENNLYIGDETGLYLMKNDGKLNTLIPDENILSLYFDDETNILMAGTYGHGIWKYDVRAKKSVKWDEKNGLINNNVFSILKNEQSYWFATLAGIQQVSAEGLPGKSYHTGNGLPTDYVYTLYIDTQNNTWAGTEGKGLVKITGDNIKTVVPNTSVFSITGDKNGNIWFATFKDGVGMWNDSGIRWINKSNGLTSENLNGIFCDPSGFIHVMHDRGIDKIDPDMITVQFVNGPQGVNKWSQNLNSFTADAKNQVFIGVTGHVIRFNPLLDKPEGPKLVASKVSCGNVALSAHKMTTVSHDNHNFLVDFSGVYFTDPDLVQFRYKLEPIEQEWRYTRDPKLIYTELKPGLYQFTIQIGLGTHFFENETQAYHFRIKPAFYRTTWFTILGILAFISLMYVFFTIRNAQRKKLSDAENEKVKMELEILKSQINPHFLFNSFNTLIGTIEEDKDHAITYVENLSDFYRNMLSYKDFNVIPLEEELKIHEKYVFLLKQRYGENFRIHLDVPDKNSYSIIPLTLQLLTENAIKHNVVSSAEPLEVNIQLENNKLTVSNPIRRRKTVEKSTHFGLHSLSKRYKDQMQKDIVIETKENIYSVTIPLLKHDPNYSSRR